jgi:hypothetical protein
VYKPFELHWLTIEVLFFTGNAPLLVKYLKMFWSWSSTDFIVSGEISWAVIGW